MKLIALVLNAPWSIMLICAALISGPRKININKDAWALIICVRSFWWYGFTTRLRGIRGGTLGNVILLGPNLLENDLEHELIHIAQHQREPFIHPLLSCIETIRHGYRQNKYEVEAYAKSNSRYIGHKL